MTADLELKAGKFAAISVESNPTTGYEWHIKVNDGTSCLDMIHSSYKANDAPKGYTGVPGIRTFLFKVSDPGCKTQLLLNYAKPWEFKEFDMVNTDLYEKININVVAP